MTLLSNVKIALRYFMMRNGETKMTNWFEDHLIVTGLSDEQNELVRNTIIEKLVEGEKDA
jgi:uncharacterized membrane-anchored protein